MNTLTVIVLLVLAVFAINGYIRGFVKTLASMFLFVLAAVLVYYATPYVSSFLSTATPLHSIVEKKCGEFLAGNDEEQKMQEMSRQEQDEWIDELPLPEILKEQLRDNNNSYIYENLMADTFGQYFARYFADLILNILSYVITFVFVTLILRMMVMTLDIITRLPVLKGANRMMGLLLGAVQGVAVLWLAFLVLTVFAHTESGGKLMTMVNESPFLSMMYNMNLFLKYLFRIIG